MKIITFQAASGNNYEIQIEGEVAPSFIWESEDGKIHDPVHETIWDSIAHMTHDLKIEIVDWGSDVGD